MGAAARLAGLVLVSVALGCGGGGGGAGGGRDGGGGNETGDLEHYDAGFFAVDKPRGWSVFTAGTCETFAFLLQDPGAPLRQIFYFGTIGPIYTTEAQKQLDEWYVANGGYPITWIDAPVVSPFTPGIFMSRWPEIADMRGAAAFMAQFPHLHGLKIVSTAERSTMLPGVAATATGESRGLFQAGAEVGEGLFLATVAGPSPLLCTDPPLRLSGCTGNGHFVCGVTAPKAEFAAKLDLFVASLNTFTVTQGYIDGCLAQAQRQWGAVAKAGQTLSEASDMLWDGWVSRTHSEDVTAETYSDAFLGRERVYDPSTSTVYDVPVGWYDTYDVNRGSYSMSGLQLLPDEASYWDLWMKATTSGTAIH